MKAEATLGPIGFYVLSRGRVSCKTRNNQRFTRDARASAMNERIVGYSDDKNNSAEDHRGNISSRGFEKYTLIRCKFIAQAD